MGVTVGSSIYNAPSIYESGAGGGGGGSVVNIGGYLYETVEFNGLLWTTSNYKGGANAIYKSLTDNFYYPIYAGLENLNIDGWRLPLKSEIQNIIDTYGSNCAYQMKTPNGWLYGWNGDNSSGVTIGPPNSWLDASNTVVEMIATEDFWARRTSEGNLSLISFTSSNNGIGIADITSTNNKYSIRLVKSL